MTDIFDDIPNTDNFWLDIGGSPHFDVSAYLNVRDEWVKKLKIRWDQQMREYTTIFLLYENAQKRIGKLQSSNTTTNVSEVTETDT